MGMYKITNCITKNRLGTPNSYFIQKCFSRINSSAGGDKDEDHEIPKNVIGPFHTAHFQKENGTMYDKKPFKILLKKEATYTWCLCGQSHNQPFCDGTHRFPPLKITLKPIRFKVAKTKEYWLCNCKQTKNRPFCDGSHKQEAVQEALKYK